ncbi:hypothetical protein D3C86_1409090 [compost metagenome]
MGKKKYLRPKPGTNDLTVLNSEPGEYILFDDNRAYFLFWRPLRSHYYTILLAKVARDTVFEADYMTLEHELYSTVIYDKDGTAAEGYTQNLLTAIVDKTVDVDHPLDFVFELGGTVLNRAPLAMSSYPLGELH